MTGPSTGKLATLACVLLLTASIAAASSPAAITAHHARPQEAGRLLLAGATIVDGLGNEPYRGDLLIEGGRIAAVGPAGGLEVPAGTPVEDLEGLVLAPGFIDIHNHSDRSVVRQPRAEALVSQGLTTIVVGADGSSPFPIDEYLREVDAAGTAVNVAVTVGHGMARRRVMGDDFRRPATAEEVASMAAIVREGMQQGAFGLSSGLEYDPGFYSETDELIALAEIAAEHGGFYISHLRDEEETVMEAIDEIIEIGFAAGLPVQISHIKMGNASVWDRSSEALAKLEAARGRGLDITADWYPYTAWASSLSVVVRSRRFADPEAVAAGLAALGGPDRLQITRYEPDPSLAGLRLDAIGRRLGKTPVEVYIEMMAAGGAGVIGHTMKIEDVNRFAASPLVMVCSDGGIGSSHPRGAGTFPRVLAHYVRDEGILTLPEAVRKMTSMPADRLGLADRGRIAAGAAADLTAFDPTTVQDHSTFERPELLSTGIERVWVAGELVWRAGNATGAGPGIALRAPGTP